MLETSTLPGSDVVVGEADLELALFELLCLAALETEVDGPFVVEDTKLDLEIDEVKRMLDMETVLLELASWPSDEKVLATC